MIQSLTATGAGLLAIGLQIAITLSLGQTGLRVSASDLVLPALLPITGLLAWRKGLRLPLWLWLPFALLAVVLVLSFLVGLQATGTIIPWALYNKLLGFAVLLGYGLLGLLLGQDEDLTRRFGLWFAGAVTLVAGASLLTHLVSRILWSKHALNSAAYTALLTKASDPEASILERLMVDQFARLEGLIANPNAFGLMVACGLLVALVWPLARCNAVTVTAGALMLAVLYLSGSRSAWLACGAGLLVLLALRALSLRKILVIGGLAALAATGIRLLVVALRQMAMPASDQTLTSAMAAAPTLPLHLQRGVGSTNHHMALIQEALALWREAPLLGNGLGSFLWRNSQGGEGYVIHNTYLWLLAETGLVGLLALGACVAVCLRALWPHRQDPTPRMALAVLAAGALAGMGIEVLYQRQLWVLVGLGLGAALAAKRAHLDP